MLSLKIIRKIKQLYGSSFLKSKKFILQDFLVYLIVFNILHFVCRLAVLVRPTPYELHLFLN